jgi:glycosyltransferase involved in cell wall biosynthesis
MLNGKRARRKKILLVATTAETFSTILKGQPEFISHSFDVAVACSFDDHFQGLKEKSPFDVYCVPMRRGISPLFDIKSIWSMVKVIKNFKPDAVHSYTPKAGLVAMLSAWFCGVPVRVHTFTGLIFPTAEGVKRKILIIVDKLISLLATNVIPESEGVKSDLISNNIFKGDLSVIGSGNIAGVDISFFSRTETAAVIESGAGGCDFFSPNTFVYCFVGRINRDKGLYELVHAFKELPFDAALLIVGALDENAPPDFLTLKEIRENDRIKCVGFKSDIRPFLYFSDIFVLPSYREGFPNVVLQAMALERPVISTNVSGANEVVIPGETGWVVPIKDTESLRLAMISAFETQDFEIERMGARARSIVVERFERERYLCSLLNFYFSIID